MTPRKSEWMELAESDGSTRDVRKIDKRLAFGTLATVSAVILGGSLFANANNEPMASAEVAVTSPAASASVASTTAPKIQKPAIASLPQGGDDEDGEDEGRNEHRNSDDHDDEDDEEDDD
jgi:hypothetical protein